MFLTEGKAFLKCCSLLLCTVTFVYAQDRGTIRGTVTDPSRAAVPVAVVIARNVDTGLNQSTQTGADGVYNIPYLPVGNYTVETEKTGFRRSGTPVMRVDVNSVVRRRQIIKVATKLSSA